MSNTEDRPTANLMFFSPQHWGEVERFSKFWPTTYEFNRRTQKRLRGIVGHYSKAGYLFQIANRLAEGLDIDEQQLKETGYSPTHNAKEVASVVESILCEQYSVLDCCRAVLCEVYPNHKGIKKSTRGTFQKAHSEELDERVPEVIRNTLRDTSGWYPFLLKLRDEITHSNVGSCHKNHDSGALIYMHDGLGTPGKSLVIEDIFAEITTFFEKINELLGVLFRELNASLEDTPTDQFCGIFGGRMYQRTVRPSEAIDIHGGVCKSHEWFDLPDHPDCPLKETCNAYSRAKGINSGTPEPKEAEQ